MATTNVVRTVVGNSPAAADSANGAGAGAEAAIATPMLETATAATKILAQADLMAEAIFDSKDGQLKLIWGILFEATTVWGFENNSDSKQTFAGATIIHITELSSGFAGTRYKQES
ncbi:hypothetical protein R1sor_022760 [Riccia sorocarpa]|uniref:Uncharacterized protein n=1 Tax=Riccia sorocarpa TaxID=122646 RepID=A0ABD3GRP8_9MARC